jgi:hypothetical protein
MQRFLEYASCVCDDVGACRMEISDASGKCGQSSGVGKKKIVVEQQRPGFDHDLWMPPIVSDRTVLEIP